MPKTKTKVLIVLLLIIDILSIGSFILFFYHTKNLITESVNKENELKNELKKDEMKALMKDDLVAGKIYQDKLSKYLVPSGGTVDFIKTIEQIVSNSNIKSDIRSVVNIPYDKGDAINEELIKVDMNVIGEWKNIQYFLKSLENYPLKIEISEVSFYKSSDYIINGKTVPQWSGSFQFTVVKNKDK